jgi:hypothetical protein
LLELLGSQWSSVWDKYPIDLLHNPRHNNNSSSSSSNNNNNNKFTFQREFPLLSLVCGRGGVGAGGVDEPAVLLPSAAHAVETDALLEHAHAEALLEAARLARLAPPLVDLAVVRRGARVLDVAWKQTKRPYE